MSVSIWVSRALSADDQEGSDSATVCGLIRGVVPGDTFCVCKRSKAHKLAVEAYCRWFRVDFEFGEPALESLPG